jgi:hypothetical protein
MTVQLFRPSSSGEEIEVRNCKILEAAQKMDGDKRLTDLTPVAPMAVVCLVTAQLNHYAGNDQNVRSRTLFHATPVGLGWVLTLVARVIRVVVRTLGIIISVPVAAFQEGRYGEMVDQGQKILKYNLVAEDVRRIGQEWADLGITFLVAAIGTVNTVAPAAISTEFLFTYYSNRTKENSDRNDQFIAARKAYFNIQDQKQTAWKNAQATFEGNQRQ